jgi:hypothetical protein
VNYLFMGLERHDRCGRCWQKKQMEPHHPSA